MIPLPMNRLAIWRFLKALAKATLVGFLLGVGLALFVLGMSACSSKHTVSGKLSGIGEQDTRMKQAGATPITLDTEKGPIHATAYLSPALLAFYLGDRVLVQTRCSWGVCQSTLLRIGPGLHSFPRTE